MHDLGNTKTIDYTSDKKLAPDVFPKKIDETSDEIPGCFGKADELILVNDSDHNTKLKAVLQHVRSAAVQFNKDKKMIRVKKFNLFLGHLLSDGCIISQTLLDSVQSETC